MTREDFIQRELREHKRDIFWSRLVIVTAVLLVLAFVAYAVQAGVQHKVTYTVSLYKGTSKVHDVAGSSMANAQANCEAEQAKQTTPATYSCKTPITTDVVTVMLDPPPLVATLTWPLVTENTNGSAYTDPFGYVINYGNAVDQLTQSVDVNDPKATTYILQGLTAGQWYFCVRARNTSNVRSDCSNVVSKTL